MSAKYSQEDITALLAERKVLPKDYRTYTQLRQKRGHKEQELDVKGESGNNFRIIVRQSNSNPLDFTVILAFCPVNSNLVFRLRRYNGKSHEHTNHIEGKTFYDFHVHMATQRYQDSGAKEDAYAESSDRFSDIHGALDCLVKDCGFDVPPGSQLALF